MTNPTKADAHDLARIKELLARLKTSAAAFRENPVYDSEGDDVYLTVQADELDGAAVMILEQAERIERLEGALRTIVREDDQMAAWCRGVARAALADEPSDRGS